MLTLSDLRRIADKLTAHFRRVRMERRAREALDALRDGAETGDDSMIAECVADAALDLRRDPFYTPEIRQRVREVKRQARAEAN